MRQRAKWLLYPPQGGACRMGLAWMIPPASRLAGGESRARAEVQTPSVRTCLSPQWVRTRWYAPLCSKIQGWRALVYCLWI